MHALSDQTQISSDSAIELRQVEARSDIRCEPDGGLGHGKVGGGGCYPQGGGIGEAGSSSHCKSNSRLDSKRRRREGEEEEKRSCLERTEKRSRWV
jgi:hypothetical protein